jgi:hypothetical protein
MKKKSIIVHNLICQRCQTTFQATRSHAQYCEICRNRKSLDKPLELRGKGKGPRRSTNFETTCKRCGNIFVAHRKTIKWCDDCKSKGYLDLPPIQRNCLWCNTPITIPRGASKAESGKRYCCDEHAKLGAKRSRLASAKRAAHGEPKRYGGRPKTLTDSESVERKKEGKVQRFFRKYPNRLPICQACGESRVIELAHKIPRNGAWPSLHKNMHSDDIWILCPTCHKCLDYGIQTAEELGLT